MSSNMQNNTLDKWVTPQEFARRISWLSKEFFNYQIVVESCCWQDMSQWHLNDLIRELNMLGIEHKTWHNRFDFIATNLDKEPVLLFTEIDVNKPELSMIYHKNDIGIFPIRNSVKTFNNAMYNVPNLKPVNMDDMKKSFPNSYNLQQHLMKNLYPLANNTFHIYQTDTLKVFGKHELIYTY